MDSPIMEILDHRLRNAIEQYEKAFFRAFGRFPPEYWSDIFELDRSNRRMRTRIAYAQQEIYIARDGNAILAAIAMNPTLNGPLQLETYGFRIERNEDTAEGLVIFSLDAPARGALLTKLGRFAFERLRGLGKKRVFGTCDARRLRAYEQLGFNRRDERPHMEDTEYLIELCLE